MSKAGIALSAILGLILIVVISVGGYLGGWWLNEDAVNRTATIDQNSYANQRGAQVSIATAAEEVASIEVKITGTDSVDTRAALAAQLKAVAARGCQSARNINQPVSQDIVDFAYNYCGISLEAN